MSSDFNFFFWLVADIDLDRFEELALNVTCAMSNLTYYINDDHILLPLARQIIQGEMQPLEMFENKPFAD